MRIKNNDALNFLDSLNIGSQLVLTLTYKLSLFFKIAINSNKTNKFNALDTYLKSVLGPLLHIVF